MLEGLMQHDHPLTLQLVLERMRGHERRRRGRDAHGRRDDARDVRRGRRARRPAVPRAARARGGRRRPGGDVRLEQPAPPRGLPRGAVHGGRAAHPEHPAVPRAARLRRQPRAGQGDPRRRLAGRRARAARRPVRDGRALRGDGRRGPLQAPGRDQLRGAARAPGARLRLPGDRRARGRRAVLHERDDRQPEGRPLLAQVEHPPHDGAVHGGRVRDLALRPHPAGGADVPRQRVGPALRGVLGRREPDHAQPLPAGRAARAADRVGEGHGRRRGADDLARRPALVGRAQARPLEHPDRGLRRRRRPAPR